jgi:hypothetical protein
MDLGQAQQQAAAARAPHDRLGAVISNFMAAERALEAAKAEDERILGEWLAEPDGPRPGPSPRTLAAEARLAALAPDAAAARQAVDQYLPQIRETQAAVTAAGDRHRELIAIAALAASDELIRDELMPRLNAVLETEARLRSVAQALRQRSLATPPWPAAGARSAQVIEALTQARKQAGVPLDHDSGERLLNALGTDPEAKL